MTEDNLHIIALLISLLSVCISTAAAIFSRNSANNSLKAARQSALQGQMTNYIQEYIRVIDLYSIEMHDINKYNFANPGIRSRIQIVSGLLVSVVDLMYVTQDERREAWREFIIDIPGPLDKTNGFDLNIYSSTEYTKKTIDEFRRRLGFLQ